MSSPRPRLTRAESLHQQVARNIRNEIDAGVLRNGDVLPSTRELAQTWGVSVFTINEAMKILIADGLVESKSRSKRVVRAPDQARRGEVRLRKPHVLLIGGYAGSGKTELGRIIARETGWPMLDKDTLTRPVVEIALEILGQSPHDRDSDPYLSTIRPREYEALVAATTENVECGNSAIVTAPFVQEFSDPSWIGRTQALFGGMNAVTTLVWVYCDADTMHTYIRRRGAARDAAKLSDWSVWLARINTDFRPSGEHVVVDNSASSAPLQDQAQELLKRILGEAA
ncbi:GntR family transcriptional regulator [Phytohabitans sp. ZYX-F-186]|uniref:GntR family transcriptional regulator n=1 Tax=Phytohabitans maris TaxID=3071409 RepID=A0ABU0ZIH5_9ACTN|nr:GntR family transcriptional regulator [Phytohabitans sp. ZYX-F-186]MDQ7906855.1 GntR family transcriptional regulator [Phytohabitans sp. ZYX-F-186]